MANYKTYMNSDFAACRLVGRGYDPHRQRDVRLYQIPGEVEVVGVSDGTDRWIAPLASPFLTVLHDALRAERAGDPHPTFPLTLTQRPDAAPVGRRRLAQDDEPVIRRRVVADEPVVRRRVVVED